MSFDEVTPAEVEAVGLRRRPKGKKAKAVKAVAEDAPPACGVSRATRKAVFNAYRSESALMR